MDHLTENSIAHAWPDPHHVRIKIQFSDPELGKRTLILLGWATCVGQSPYRTWVVPIVLMNGMVENLGDYETFGEYQILELYR